MFRYVSSSSDPPAPGGISLRACSNSSAAARPPQTLMKPTPVSSVPWAVPRKSLR